MFGNLRQLKITLAFLVSGSIVHANNSEGIEYFETHIRPLFVEHCYECHSADAKELKAKLYLDSRTGWQTGGDSGPAIIPGKPEDSLLLNAISYTNSDLEMPPKNRLPDSKILHLKSWIAMGALTLAKTNPKNPPPKSTSTKGANFGPSNLPLPTQSRNPAIPHGQPTISTASSSPDSKPKKSLLPEAHRKSPFFVAFTSILLGYHLRLANSKPSF